MVRGLVKRLIHRAVTKFGAMALFAVCVWYIFAPTLVGCGIVQEHRGTITVQPVPKQGTTFVVALPALNAGACS